jgi:hypothetical protein
MVTEKPAAISPTKETQTADMIYHALVVVSAVGLTLLVINICCYIAIFRKA